MEENHNNQQLGEQKESKQRSAGLQKGGQPCSWPIATPFQGQESVSDAVPGSGTTKPQKEGPLELTPPAGGALNELKTRKRRGTNEVC